MTPCPRCSRHVREPTCPFCGAECVHHARIDLGRVARSTLFAVGAVALYDCSSVAMYGFSCLGNDACTFEPPDDAATSEEYHFPSVDGSEADAEAGSDSASDSGSDSASDSGSGSGSDSDSD